MPQADDPRYRKWINQGAVAATGAASSMGKPSSVGMNAMSGGAAPFAKATKAAEPPASPATIKATPEMSKARPVVPSIGVMASPARAGAVSNPVNPMALQSVGVSPAFNPPAPITSGQMSGARASLQGALPQSIAQQQAQNDARAAVNATQPQVGIDTTTQMEARNQAFRDVGAGAARFDQGPSGTGPVRGLVANTPVATGPVAAGFAGTGVGSPASATGARIGRATPTATTLATPMDQAQAEDRLKNANVNVQVPKAAVDAQREQAKAYQADIAARKPVIDRMNANYSADRLARAESRQVRGQEDRFARASLSAALTDPDPRVRAAALEASGQSNERYAKAAAPTGGFAGARDQLRNEQFAKDQLASQERVAQSVAESKALPARLRAESAVKVAEIRSGDAKRKMEAELSKFKSEMDAKSKGMSPAEADAFSAQGKTMIASAETLFALANKYAEAGRDDEAASMLDEARDLVRRAGALQSTTTNPARPVDSGAQGGNNTPPQAAIDKLKSNPSLRAAFDQKYGAGAAAKYLGS